MNEIEMYVNRHVHTDTDTHKHTRTHQHTQQSKIPPMTPTWGTCSGGGGGGGGVDMASMIFFSTSEE